MNNIEQWIQAFETKGEVEKSNLEVAFNVIMLDWARKQPASPLGFIDVASGLGIEAKTLFDNGFPSIAQDPSAEMVKHNVHGFARVGNAHQLDYPDSSFSGILIKDAWLFLSPEQRLAFLQEAKRTLVDDGSVLLQSERADVHRGRYLPKESQISQTLSSFDFSSYQEWLNKIAEMQKDGDSFYAIEYACLPEDVEKLTSHIGLQPTTRAEYDSKHSLATQSRWVKRSGFILELKKV